MTYDMYKPKAFALQSTIEIMKSNPVKADPESLEDLYRKLIELTEEAKKELEAN